MTPADKLRSLLASRPAMPNTEELVRWWRTSAELLPALLDQPKVLTTGRLDGLEITPIRDGDEIRFLEFNVDTLPGLRLVLEAGAASELCEALGVILGNPALEGDLRADLDDARAKLRREQDARAELRLELDRVTECLKKANANHEDYERRWYLANDQLDARIAWQVQAVAHMQAWRGLFDAAVAMDEQAEGCLVEPACGDCTRCRFHAAVDEAMKATAANSHGFIDASDLRADLDRQRAAVDVLKQEVRELEQQRDHLRAELDRATGRAPMPGGTLLVGDKETPLEVIGRTADGVVTLKVTDPATIALLKNGAEPVSLGYLMGEPAVPAVTGHPESWLDCAACRARSKSGAEPPRCEEFLALEAARAERDRMEAGHV